MFLTRIRFSIVGDVYLRQLCKGTVKPSRFCSNVSNIKTENKEDIRESSHRRSVSLTRKQPHFLRLASKVAAGKIVGSVKRIFKDKVVLEFSAGSGILSSALLSSGKSIVALESQAEYHSALENLQDKHKKEICYLPKQLKDVIALSKEDLLKEVNGIELLNNGSDVQIIGLATSWFVLIEIARRARDPASFLHGSNINLFLCLPESEWKYFLDSQTQKMCVVERILFKLAFSYKSLGQLQRGHFYTSRKRRKGLKEALVYPTDNIELIHVQSKLQNDFDLTELQVFLTQFHNCASRNRLIIPALEQWAPSCGEELVRKGMPVFRKFSELSPEELLDLYRYFKSLPSVEASDFLLEWRG